MTIDLMRIPEEMRSVDQWVVCKGNSKIPYQPSGDPASSTDPSTWCSFQDAMNAVGWVYFNVGFVLTESDPFVIIDYDEECPQDVIDSFDTYTEYSRSGRGVHIIMRGSFTGKKRKGKVECYQDNRYMIMTGDVVNDAPVRDCQKQLDKWRSKHELDVTESATTVIRDIVPTDALGSLEDIKERMFMASNGREIRDLFYNGHTAGDNASDVDAALLEHLRFWSGGNREIACALFEQSACCREKWIKREDYRNFTWNFVTSKGGEVWTPPVDECEWGTDQMVVGEDFCSTKQKSVDATQRDTLGDTADGHNPDEDVPKNLWQEDDAINLTKDQYWPEDLGMLSDVCRFFNETSPMKCPELSMHVALACLSVCLARRFATISGNYTSLYYACIAPSGGGKGHGFPTIKHILKSLDPSYLQILQGSGYTADSAIFSALQDAPAHLTYLDELGDYITGSRGDGNGSMKTQWRTLKEAWSSNSTICPKRYSDHTVGRKSKATMHCEVPQITIMGCSTPEQFWDSLGPQDTADGFLNRWLINTVEKKPERSRSIVNINRMTLPSSMYKWHERICDRSPIGMTVSGDDEESSTPMISGPADIVPEPVMINWDNGVNDLFYDYQTKLIDDNFGKGIVFDMFQRAGQMAMNISLIVELSKNPDASYVTMPSAKWAIGYVNTVLSQMVTYAKRNLAGSAEEGLSQKFLKEVRKAGADGITLSQFYKKKPSGGERKKIMDSIKRLEDMNPPVIRMVPNYHPPGKRGRGSMTWFAVEGHEDE